jgi:hypothetical protein
VRWGARLLDSVIFAGCRFRRQATSEAARACCYVHYNPSSLREARPRAQPEPVRLDANVFKSVSVNPPVIMSLPFGIGSNTLGEDTMRPSRMIAISFWGSRERAATCVAA